MSIRPVKRIIESKPTIEGAGVKLRRAFGFGDTGEFDPFLLLDDFRNDRPEDYRAGFPWHPHRGIETITYVLAGSVDHGDSLGNRGKLGSGDVQWMTAGRGIMHQEMPQGDSQGRMHGFQLWAILPSSLKMTAPRYQDVKGADIPEIVDDEAHVCVSSVASSGGRKGRWTVWPPIRAIWMCLCPRTSGKHSKLKSNATPLLMSSRATESLPRRPSRSAYFQRNKLTARKSSSESRLVIVLLSFLMQATTSPFRPATMASVSCWCPESRSRSPSLGTGRL